MININWWVIVFLSYENYLLPTHFFIWFPILTIFLQFIHTINFIYINFYRGVVQLRANLFLQWISAFIAIEKHCSVDWCVYKFINRAQMRSMANTFTRLSCEYPLFYYHTWWIIGMIYCFVVQYVFSANNRYWQEYIVYVLILWYTFEHWLDMLWT